MYRATRSNPIKAFKVLARINSSKLTFLEHSYAIGLITAKEWMELRSRAIKGNI